MNAPLYMQHAIHHKNLIYIASIAIAVSFMSSCAQTTAELKLPDYTQSGNSITASYDRQRAIEKGLSHWGKKYAEDPQNPEYAQQYANSLIVAGKIDHAFKILGKAFKHNPDNMKLISEYGRLALKMEKVSLADKILSRTADKEVKDWRILSARGTLLARRNRHREAQELFKQALRLAPEETSIQNNLALSYAFDGKPGKAEELLRQISSKPDTDPKIIQNLALVLGLQGRFDEAEKIAQNNLPPKDAKKNISYLKKLVSNPIKPRPKPPVKQVTKPEIKKQKLAKKPVNITPSAKKKTDNNNTPAPTTIKFPEAVVNKENKTPEM